MASTATGIQKERTIGDENSRTRSGTTYPAPMPRPSYRLPIELWLEILSYTTTPAIASLTLTCRTFRWLAQPLLFKLFVVQHHPSSIADPSSTCSRRDCSQNSQERLAILEYPYIMNVMTEIRLIPSTAAWNMPRDQGPQPPPSCNILDTIFAALPSLGNLQTLVCHDVVFTKEYLSALSRVPRLKDLELQSCVAICEPHDFPDFSDVPLDTLNFNYPFNSPSKFGIPPNHFLALFLQSRKLRRIVSGPNDDILVALQDSPPLPSLSILEIPVSCLASPHLIPSLYSCESIQDFSLYMATGDTRIPTLNYLPPDVLPNLRSYRGPQAYANWFTQDRGVTDVAISLPAQPSDLCTTLIGIAKEVESLSCKVDSLDPALFKTIHKTFPSLKHLAISGVAVDVDCLSSMLRIANVHSALTSIQISVETGLPRLTDSWGATVAKMVLACLFRAYPVLQHATLVYQPQVSVVWNRSKAGKQLVAAIESSELRIEKQHEVARTNAIWDMLRLRA